MSESINTPINSIAKLEQTNLMNDYDGDSGGSKSVVNTIYKIQDGSAINFIQDQSLTQQQIHNSYSTMNSIPISDVGGGNAVHKQIESLVEPVDDQTQTIHTNSGKRLRKPRHYASDYFTDIDQEEDDEKDDKRSEYMKKKMNCKYTDCKNKSRGKSDYCIKHGGGIRCTYPGCHRGARDKMQLCMFHGGGARCTHPSGCTKGAVGGVYCIRHGGGKRCAIPNCEKSVARKSEYCNHHKKSILESTNNNHALSESQYQRRSGRRRAAKIDDSYYNARNDVMASSSSGGQSIATSDQNSSTQNERDGDSVESNLNDTNQRSAVESQNSQMYPQVLGIIPSFAVPIQFSAASIPMQIQQPKAIHAQPFIQGIPYAEAGMIPHQYPGMNMPQMIPIASYHPPSFSGYVYPPTQILPIRNTVIPQVYSDAEGHPARNTFTKESNEDHYGAGIYHR